ncbi:MAG: polyphenol oxidase family protein [Planctomycetota bacterium]|nr:polyphenol oxidase family protein [Planctomycetota bacterium]
MKQVEHRQLVGFCFRSNGFASNKCAHVFGARNSSDQGNFAFSGGRDITAATAVRKSWCEYLVANPERLVVGGQTHTNNVVVVDDQLKGRGALSPSTVIPACDGLITTTPGLPLYVAVADCSAVLLSAPGIIAVVHGGWRGLQSNIMRVAIDKMVDLKADRQQICAGIAPCISAVSYEVGPEVAADCPTTAKYQGQDDRWQVDISKWANQQLLEAGLSSANIEVSGVDSGSDNRIFSHRRQGVTAGRNGLLAVLDA